MRLVADVGATWSIRVFPSTLRILVGSARDRVFFCVKTSAAEGAVRNRLRRSLRRWSFIDPTRNRVSVISLSRDVCLLFGTRFIRLFAYGLISVVLLLYLAELGFTEAQGGVLLTLVLVGDIGVSLWITTRADRLGRRTMLLISSLLMIAGGVA